MPAPLLRSRSRRTWVLPIAILVVAGLVAAWGTRREMGRAGEVERQLAALCTADGGSAAAGVAEVPGLDEHLARLRGEAGRGAAVEVRVQPGDVATLGDGTATHHAVIAVGGRPRLGLRVRHDAEEPVAPLRVRVIGYWLPGAAAP